MEKIPSKSLSCHCHRDMMVCVKPLPARMTAGLSCGIPGHDSSICPGRISGSMTKNTDSTTFPSGGGARPATHSWMMCGETMEPVNCPFCSPPADVIVAKNRFCYARWDRYPVSKGHMLVIPFRHVQDFLTWPVRKNVRYSNWSGTVSG